MAIPPRPDESDGQTESHQRLGIRGTRTFMITRQFDTPFHNGQNVPKELVKKLSTTDQEHLHNLFLTLLERWCIPDRCQACLDHVRQLTVTVGCHVGNSTRTRIDLCNLKARIGWIEAHNSTPEDQPGDFRVAGLYCPWHSQRNERYYPLYDLLIWDETQISQL